ncbi:MAG TPA: AMP-binding protein, partial [Stellaceae bacterium]|nr:AMP-binding protein [Stellaceae bacterium]
MSPTRPALIESAGHWNYGELSVAIARAGELLARAAVRRGDRVMIVSENCRAAVALFLAATESGAWPVMVNPRLSAPEMHTICHHCGARRVFFTAGLTPQARAHAERYRAVVQDLAGLDGLSMGPLNQEAAPEEGEKARSDDVAALVYTSGSTSMPKAVMLTHRNLLFIATASGTIRSLAPADRLYAALPMSHIVGLSVVTLGALMHGASLYLYPRFNPAEALASLERDRLTI